MSPRLINPLLRAQTFTQTKGMDAGSRKLRREVQRLKSRLVTPPENQDVPDDWTVIETTDDVPEPDARHVGRLLHHRNARGADAVSIGIQQADDSVVFVPFTLGPPSGQWSLSATFGSTGNGNGQFNNPSALAVAPDGSLWVSDLSNHRLQHFSALGSYLGQTGSAGSGNGQFANASGLAIDGSGNIYVADTGNNRIQKLNSSGVYVSQFGTAGGGNGQFNAPNAVALDGGGNIYVADTFNNRVQKFTSGGVYTTQWGTQGSGAGQLWLPRGIALDGSGNVYVADSANNRIQQFTGAGAFLSQFGAHGNAEGLYDFPNHLAFDASGNLFVADAGNDRIQKVDAAGGFLAKIGSRGVGEGQFQQPVAVAVSGRLLYVADFPSNHVSIWVASVAGVYTVRANSASVGGGATGTVTATCNAGEVAVGGGYDDGNPGNTNMVVHISRPNVTSGTPTGWTCTARNGTGGALTLICYAVCLA